MGVFDNIGAPAKPTGGVFGSVPATPVKTGGVFANVTNAPKAAPAAAPAAASPYFQGKEPTGTFIGISDQTDPFSGRPFLAYRLPGATATTTDTTRTAPLIDPEKAAPTVKTNFQNPRMPESASQAIRKASGATSDEQLDHRMALTLGGSNDDSNLKLISTTDNQAASSGEGEMTQEISDGKLSLFNAQLAEAKAKGLNAPFVDQAPEGSVFNKVISGTFNGAGILAGAKNLAATVASEALKLVGSNETQVNPAGLANLQQLSDHLDPVLQKLGSDGDALSKMHDDLQATKVDQNNPASVAVYNTKVDTFNKALQSYNFKSPEGAKLAGMFNTAVDAYNSSVVKPSGVYGMWSSFLNESVLQPYLTAVTAAGDASADVTENLSNPDGTMKPINKIDWAAATSNELKFISAGMSAAADPGMVPYQVANATPVVGHVLDPVNWLFGQAGRGGAAAANAFGLTTAVINKLPISKDDKTQLSTAIQDVGSTLGQFAAGAFLFGRAGKLLEMKGNPLANFKDMTLSDAKDLVDSTKKFADAVKQRLPQNLQEAQRGFAKLPGIDDKETAPESEQNTKEEPVPDELQPLADEAKKFSSVEDLQTSLENRKTTLESIRDSGLADERVTNAIKDLETKTKAATPEFFDKVKKPKESGVVDMKIPPLTRMASQLGVPKPSARAALTDLALQQKSPHDFYLALTEGERNTLLHTIDPNGLGMTAEEAAHAYYAHASEHVAPPDQELQTKKSTDVHTSNKLRPQEKPTTQPVNRQPQQPLRETENNNKNGANVLNSSYSETITEHNGGVNPPENKGGMQPPEIDWSKGKDIAAIRQSTDTLERTLEKVFPKEEADALNEFLTNADRHNEAEKVKYVTAVRKETQEYVVKKLGIKPATVKSAWVQRLGEGRTSLAELQREMPNDWKEISKASDFFRGKYDELIDKWNGERSKAGLKPINKRPNYFRHFIDLTTFSRMYGLNFTDSKLPTAISGMTEFFRSQSPWTNAAMRRLGSTTTDDAVGGFDNYLDSAARAIYHTDTVQRGRLVEKYLSKSADENLMKAQDIRDSGEDKVIPPPIDLPVLRNTLKQWSDKVSGKQNIVDRVIESHLGRKSIAVMRAITRQFGANVIGGNVGAAVTHAIPMVYTLATVDKGAAFHGLYGTLTSPFLEDFRKIDGVQSDFLTRRFGKEEIEPTIGEKVGGFISAPFHWVDQFMSRFAVESKFQEGVAKGMQPAEAMKVADNYASRVIGDRSSGNLPPIMGSKLLGPLTQFQIEVNDNLRVLIHDIPRWEGGDKLKIANRFAQFAVYSYLFNQTMQYIKGSGKGLDPIDLGLTLMGLNDEGHDKTLGNRLASVGGDFLKEMPFTSVLTGGQIPAFQPLVQAAVDATTGAPLKGLEGVLASFASPVGGGQQLQKSLTAIQAWRQGYVTDSKGNITATVPQTLPTLAQGVLFGKSAFDSVKKANTEIGNLDATLKEGQAASKLKNVQADNIWLQLKTMPADKAKAQLESIAKQDPDMAKRVIASAKVDAENITKQDSLLKELGVANGARAKYIAGKLNDMGTADEKKAYLEDLAKKKIVTAQVLEQLAPLLKK